MPKQLPSKSPLAASLPSLSREALEKILSDLYEKFDTVRNFIDLKMTGNSDPLLKKYKKLIKNRLIEDIEDGTNGLVEAEEAVREFLLFSPAPRDQADVMLFFVESAVFCIADYGDLYYEFYEEAENMFEEALKFIKHHRLLVEYQERAETVVQNSADFGYGFHDSLGDTFSIYYDKGKSRKMPVVKKPEAVKKIKKAMPKKAGS